MKNLEIFDPTFVPKEREISFVPRPATLEGLRVGLVENRKHNSKEILVRIAEILEKEYGAQSHMVRSKHNPGVPAHDEILQDFSAHCDVVIAGIGD